MAVVIPCRDAEAWIADAIRSALDQPCPGVEILVVDDGSADGSVAVARGFGEAVAVETGPNRGACAARNRGLARTARDWILFLDADDRIEGDLLAAGARIGAREGADVVFAPMLVRRPDGSESLRAPPQPLSPPDLFDGWLLGLQINPSATLWRADFLRRIGGWDEAAPINQDGELVLRALLAGARPALNLDGRGVYNLHNADSISRRLTPAKLEGYLYVYDKLIRLARGTPFEGRMRSIRFELYRVARRAFAQGEIAIGRRALALLRRIGFDRHHGSLSHRLAASLLGLEAKVRIWGS